MRRSVIEKTRKQIAIATLSRNEMIEVAPLIGQKLSGESRAPWIPVIHGATARHPC